MELVLPNNCVAIEQEEMMYLEGEGILALLTGAIGGLAAAAGAVLPTLGIAGTVAVPFIGAVSKSLIVGAAAALPAFFGAFAAGHGFGTIIENEGRGIAENIRSRIDQFRAARQARLASMGS